MNKEQKIEHEKNVRARKCFDEIDKICKKYNCKIDPIMTVTSTQVHAAMNIIAL